MAQKMPLPGAQSLAGGGVGSDGVPRCPVSTLSHTMLGQRGSRAARLRVCAQPRGLDGCDLKRGCVEMARVGPGSPTARQLILRLGAGPGPGAGGAVPQPDRALQPAGAGAPGLPPAPWPPGPAHLRPGLQCPRGPPATPLLLLHPAALPRIQPQR